MALTELINQYSVQDLQTRFDNTTANDELDKDAFLHLLVTQLKNQDPLEPLKNEEFVAQLAQFNSLEQMINLNQSFEKLLTVQQLTQASNLIGQPIAYIDDEGEMKSGIGQTVTMEDGIAAIQIGDDHVELDNILGFGQATSGSILAEASYLIGKEVSWIEDDGAEQSGTVNSVEMQSGVPVLIVDGDTEAEVGLSQIIAVTTSS